MHSAYRCSTFPFSEEYRTRTRKMAGLILINIVFTYTAFGIFRSVNSIDMWGAREQPCFQIKETMPLDLDWLESVKKWYHPRLSRHNLYNKAVDLLGLHPEDVEEGPMYYDSCITFEVTPPHHAFHLHGYNGRSKQYNSTAIKPYGQVGKFYPADGAGYSGTYYTTLTDNKTFRFAAVCSTDGVMDWTVMSPEPELPEKTWHGIRKHALGLGFKKEYFTQLRLTETCGNSGDIQSGENVGWRSDIKTKS